jgi:acetylornithine/succinyldiaminopimelate/putrescine aminotransferase
VERAPEPIERIFFCNSGAEANEAAMKLVRRHTGRDQVVSFEGSFHGRTQGALSATGIERYHERAGPLVPGHLHLPWNSTEALTRIDGSCAAVLLEPIQSMAGVRDAPLSWYAALRDRCDEVGALLIFDEVQTGIGRVGTFFSHLWTGIEPDLITIAKGAASGFPFGATLVSGEVSAGVRVGDLGSTFGGGPIACAVAAETVRVVEEEGLADNARRTGEAIAEELAPLPGVARVRGRGLLLGIELTEPSAREVATRFRDAGILLGTSLDPRVVRLLPPLTLATSDLPPFFEAAREILR